MSELQVPTQYEACRAYGHAWDFTTVDRSGGEWIQGMRCIRCTTQRQVRVNVRNGLREHGNRYVYPEDISPEAAPYKAPKGTGRMTAEVRGQITLDFIKNQGYNDEVGARRRKRRK